MFKSQYVGIRDKFGIANKAFADQIVFKGKHHKITDLDEHTFDQIHNNLDSFDVSGNRSTQMQSGMIGSGVGGRNAILQTSTGTNNVGLSSSKTNQQNTLFTLSSNTLHSNKN